MSLRICCKWWEQANLNRHLTLMIDYRRMDYMSSEDSSEGDDSGLAPGVWQRLADSARTDRNGQLLVHDKVLEVKTPRWRSVEVSDRGIVFGIPPTDVSADCSCNPYTTGLI
jgi:hypothetical protein